MNSIKKIAVSVLLLLAISSHAIADSKLNELAPLATPIGSDLYYCVQSATDYKCTLQQIFNSLGSIPVILAAADYISIDGGTNPRTDHTVLEVINVAGIDNVSNLHLHTDMNNRNNVHAIETDYTTSGMTPGDEAHVYDAHIDTNAATGGKLAVLAVDKSGVGTLDVTGMEVYSGINVIEQYSGIAINVDQAFIYSGGFVASTAAFSSSGTNVQIFVNNNDYIYFGHADKFSSIQVMLAINAVNPGIKPVFEYSLGGSSWSSFSPADGTSGFRSDGGINWSADSLSGWVVDTVNAVSNKYWIRIQRTQASLGTVPTESTLKIVVSTEYNWDENGDIKINNLNAITGVMAGSIDAPVNDLDVEGNAVIGAAYAGSNSAPANGLLVEGRASFGASSPLSRNYLSIYNAATEISASSLFVNQGSADYSNTYAGYFIADASVSSAGAFNKYGISSVITTANSNTYDLSAINGLQSLVTHSGNGTIAAARGLWVNAKTGGTSTGTISNLYGAYIQSDRQAGSTITAGYGVRITGFDATTVYGLHIGTSTCTNCWDIYASNAGAKNYFAGNIGIGTTLAQHPLEARLDGAGFQTILAVENMQAAAADVGPRIMFEGVSNSDMASIQSGWNGAATTDAYLAFYTRGTSALTEKIRITSDGKMGIGTNAPTETLDVNADTIRVRTARTPASATETCNAGEIAWDSGFVYVCIAANTWKRATLATW